MTDTAINQLQLVCLTLEFI